LLTENEQQNAVAYGMLSAATLPYLMFINDVTVVIVIKLTAGTQH